MAASQPGESADEAPNAEIGAGAGGPELARLAQGDTASAAAAAGAAGEEHGHPDDDDAVDPVIEEVDDDELDQLSAEERREATAKAEALKTRGNALYGAGSYAEARDTYMQAVQTAPHGATELAVYNANLAAAFLKLGDHENAVTSCTEALKIDPSYVKALMRRAVAYKELDSLELALQDAKKVQELDAENAWAPPLVAELQPLVATRQEAAKAEMLGKLKDLGNTVLGTFGLSLDNFKMEQDPNTGGYSIKFQQ